MNRVVFVEDFSSSFDYSKHLIVALNSLSHYNLLKRDVAHYCISDFMDIKHLVKDAEEYNKIRTSFFESCDEYFKPIRINDDLHFAPFHMMAYEFALIFDSLFSQTMIILEVLRQLNAQEVILLTSYRPGKGPINYIYEHKLRVEYYDYLYYEIISQLCRQLEYKFLIRMVSVDRMKKLKVWVRKRMKSSKAFNIYSRLKKARGDSTKIEDSIGATFGYLKGKRVLFLDKGWGLDKVVRHVLNENDTTFILEGDYLCIYQGSRLRNGRKLKYQNSQQAGESGVVYDASARAFGNFIQEALGVSLDELVQRRLSYINQSIAPSLLAKAIVIDDMLRELKVDYVIGNMKYDEWRYVLAYIGTYKRDCEFIYFTHGYDMHDTDRTFIELPCNKYYTVNEEFGNYLRGQFERQKFYIKPREVSVIPRLYE